jgi:hypothetical protein
MVMKRYFAKIGGYGPGTDILFISVDNDDSVLRYNKNGATDDKSNLMRFNGSNLARCLKNVEAGNWEEIDRISLVTKDTPSNIQDAW